MNLRGKSLFLFDVDGVLYAGKERLRLIGGLRITQRLKELGKRFFILTNISTHTRAQIAGNLRSLGFRVTEEDILNSTYLTAAYLRKRYGSARCFVLGEEGLRQELLTAGHVLTEESPRVVVIGLDRRLTYERLNHAYGFLRAGADLVAGHMARAYMYENAPALAPGPIVKALEYASGKRASSIGKPSPVMFRLAMELGRARPSETVMVGDQIETDAVGAKRLGIFTVITLSGVETRNSIARSKVKPDLVVANVDDLLRYL